MGMRWWPLSKACQRRKPSSLLTWRGGWWTRLSGTPSLRDGPTRTSLASAKTSRNPNHGQVCDLAKRRPICASFIAASRRLLISRTLRSWRSSVAAIWSRPSARNTAGGRTTWWICSTGPCAGRAGPAGRQRPLHQPGQYDHRLGLGDERFGAQPLQRLLQMPDVGGPQVHQRVRPTRDRVRPDHLRVPPGRLRDLRRSGTPGAVQLDERLRGPAERRRVDHRGEGPDHAGRPEPVHPPLHRRGRQRHLRADLGVRLPGVRTQDGDDPPVDFVHHVAADCTAGGSPPPRYGAIRIRRASPPSPDLPPTAPTLSPTLSASPSTVLRFSITRSLSPKLQVMEKPSDDLTVIESSSTAVTVPRCTTIVFVPSSVDTTNSPCRIRLLR